MKRKTLLFGLGLSLLTMQGAAQQLVTGPSSSQSPYVIPTIPGARVVSLLTVGDNIDGYRLVGIPDGMGAYDNGDGTFTVLLNHELGATSGIARAHGATGAFVSKWIIRKSDMRVVSGTDLIRNVKLWDAATASYLTYNAGNPSTLARFARFCSADLPAVTAFYNPATGLGTTSRIFMNGEESGAEGRGMAHVATGPEAGTSYQLPRLGRYSYENAVAHPNAGDKTVVVGLDDASPGQVYVYIGNKTATGNEVERAGLTNGKLYGVAVSGMVLESSASFPAANTAFSLVEIPNIQNISGAQLESASNALGVTRFLRPEDGAWDPRHPADFYFVTTNSFNAPSRMWRLRFNNVNDFSEGGTITAVLDGTERQRMLDNIGFDQWGHLILQEDVGNNAHLGKHWQYNVDTDELVEIASHDPNRFITGGSQFLTQDEEGSGIIDMQDILGAGWFLGVDQAHYGIGGELVEGGQMYAFYNPATYNAACAHFNPVINVTPSPAITGQQENTIYLGYGPSALTLTGSAASPFGPVSFIWSNGGNTAAINVQPLVTTEYLLEVTNSIGCKKTIAQTIHVRDIRDGGKDKVFICKSGKTLSISVNAVPAHLANGALLGNCETANMLARKANPASMAVLYPNPTSHTATINLNLDTDEQVVVRVFDLQGREVLPAIHNNMKAGAGQISLNTARLVNGTYFVQVNTSAGSSKIQMVVAH